jgi:ABC-type phosphate transport system auxiliary subunit
VTHSVRDTRPLALPLDRLQDAAVLGGGLEGMRLNQRGIDLLLDLQDTIELRLAMDQDELRDLLVEVQTVLRDLLARDVPDQDRK